MPKQVSFNKIYTFLVCLIIFLIPSNLFLKINPATAFVNGLSIDYLIPKFYGSDIPIIMLLSLWLIEVIVNKQKIVTKTSALLLPSILISLIIIRQIFTPHPIAAAWYLLKLIELGFLSWFLITHHKLFQNKLIYYAVITTIWFQSLLAIWQFDHQKSFLNYSFFGEVSFSSSVGLAKDVWWQTGRVLPYGTTAHPNILGGILVVFSLFLITWLLKTKNGRIKILAATTILLAVIAIILTQSISALASLVIGSLLILLKPYYQKIVNINKKLLIGVGLIIIAVPLLVNVAANSLQNDSLTRRAYLQDAAISMFLDNPLVGIGLNQFTARVEEYSQTKEVVRFVQPVHHIGLLWLAETGVLGGLLVLLLGIRLNLRKIVLPLLILLPIAVLDHYLLTQQAGLLLVVFSLMWKKD